MSTDLHNLELLLRSHFPIIVIETHDEQRAIDLLKKAALNNRKLGALRVWSASEGLSRAGTMDTSQLKIEGMDYQPANYAKKDASDPETALKEIKNQVKNSLVVLPDFHTYLTNPIVLRLAKEISQQFYINNTTLVFVSHSFDVPDEIERMCTHFELSMPSKEQILKMIKDEAKVWTGKHDAKVKTNREAINLLVNNLTGFTTSDVKRFIRRAIYDDGAITDSDIKEVMEAKYKMLSMDGALTYEYDTANFSDVGGFSKLKSWLELRKPFFIGTQEDDGFDIPKGMLLLGVQGCGKSLAAKAVAGVWGVPLLKLDFGALYNKYIGETEKNIRDALKSAEMLAPCVMWIDEIEKSIQGSGDETGTSSRILGTLLTWMAENTARVFIVATSNDVKSLPPELMRKGRLDEIFFVDLPDSSTRKTIFELHLKKRNHDPATIDTNILANISEGFSGAEIEQAVVSARYAAHADKTGIRTEHLIAEIKNTRPLSVVRAEDIAYLRQWAQDRTVGVE